MKRYIISYLLVCLFAVSSLFSQSGVFLHHSTGGAVYSSGVEAYFNNYNSQNGTNYSIIERPYPSSPYPWDNYAYDYWYLWVDGNCNSEESGIECLETLTQEYDVIIWKHCYPGADIIAADGKPNISSSRKTLANYKLQYNALKEEMAKYPNTKFIVWTLAPRHRLATNPANAARAKEFVEWVRHEWLKENPGNIYLFDFYAHAAQEDESTTNDDLYCLRYEYERNHEKRDSHPNSTANKKIAPIFAQAIIDVMQTSSLIEETSENDFIYPNPSYDYIKLANKYVGYKYQVVNLLGLTISEGQYSDQIDVSSLPTGVYVLKVNEKYFRFVKE